MKQSALARVLALSVMLLCAAAAARAEQTADLDWKVSTSLNYESGTYGTGVRSSSLYLPLTLKRYWGDWSASLTLPYLRETSDGSVTNVAGRSFRIRNGSGQAATTTTRSGLGDAVVRGGYVLLHDDPQPLDLTAIAKIKLPTASRSKGLGTGEFDEELGLEAGKLVAPGWTLLGDAYYTFIGSPPGTHLNNELAADVGFSHPLNEVLTLTVLLEGSNALVTGASAPFDLSGTVDAKVTPELSVFGGVLAGLTRGSADYGVRAGGSFRF